MKGISLQTALIGAEERFMPILVTGLGRSGEPCRKIEGPMDVVILGGLLSSNFLNLYLLPALALHFGRFQEVVP